MLPRPPLSVLIPRTNPLTCILTKNHMSNFEIILFNTALT